MQLMKTKFLHPLGRWQKGSGLETKSLRITLRVSQTQNITAARADVINVVDHNEPLKEQVKNAEDIVREQETTISALQKDLSSLMSACGVAARELQLEVKNDLLELVQFQENDNGGEIESTEDPLLVQERGHEKEAELSTLHDKLLVQGREAKENLIPASDTRALFDKINGIQQQIEVLSYGQKELNSTLAGKDREIQGLKEAAEATELELVKAKTELSKLISGLEKLLVILAGNDPVVDPNFSESGALLQALERKMTSLLLESESSKSRAQEFGLKLAGSEKLVDKLSSKVKEFEDKLQSLISFTKGAYSKCREHLLHQRLKIRAPWG
ncbi:Trans-Golgi network-localized SYP41-interacting protein 1 [Cardamine amara subsp. amara]|uniref:Trans-Golgi network-localized SYP41-interacting protein 1 n=1 Tax=Cardamine amara subsp. amara TaxID=228776 RepID=A0ABD0ZUV6_CARAN